MRNVAGVNVEVGAFSDDLVGRVGRLCVRLYLKKCFFFFNSHLSFQKVTISFSVNVRESISAVKILKLKSVQFVKRERYGETLESIRQRGMHYRSVSTGIAYSNRELYETSDRVPRTFLRAVAATR